MKTLKKLFILASIVAGCLSANAQNTYSGYFLDNYTYRYEMNPAFGNEKGFVSMPALGNINVALRGNLHLTDLIYKNPNGDGTILFTNPGISADEAMSKFGNRNKFDFNTKFNILAFGFKAFGGYNTFTLSAQANAGLSVPKAFFSLAKEGISNTTYDIRDMFARANAYATVALNHSHDIKQVPGLRIGASLKVLIGAGAFDLRFNEADLTLGKDAWTAKVNADIYGSIAGAQFEKELYTPENPSDGAPYEYVTGVNLDDGLGFINGYGLAFDLGAEYKWRDFHFSAAVLDLGFMSWGKTIHASTGGTKTFTTDAYTFSADGNASNSFDNEFNRLTDDLSNLFELREQPEMGSYTKTLGATLNFGVDYELPYYRKLHFGLLNSTRIDGPYSWTQFRLSANVAPVKWFSADINAVYGTFGFGYGWMLNLHATGFNFFIGMDQTVGKLSKQLIPLNSNATLNFGLNFPF